MLTIFEKMGSLMATAVRRAMDYGVEKLGLKERPELLFQDWFKFIYFERRFICAIKVS